ncbi:unnamed protein product [marine sediment metagenome]|uniref:Uncharacterized protein n=1 Tax=marine sediment metagenome TaxID=412755 RepID=X1BGZ3_9ZZZZ
MKQLHIVYENSVEIDRYETDVPKPEQPTPEQDLLAKIDDLKARVKELEKEERWAGVNLQQRQK